LSRFARDGDASHLHRALGRYVRDGYGGSGTASQRLGRTASTAAALHGVLSGLASGTAGGALAPLDRATLEGRGARTVIAAVVEAIRPVDGTLDAEASRAAMNDALSDLLSREPDADLLNLSDEQRLLAIELFVARDVFQRFQLDVGQTITRGATSALNALQRLQSAFEYIAAVVAAEFRGLREVAPTSILQVAGTALRRALEVFEGEAE
jgi:hypothetical protein